MKICLPTESQAGLLAELSPNVGSAPFLTLIAPPTSFLEFFRS